MFFKNGWLTEEIMVICVTSFKNKCRFSLRQVLKVNFAFSGQSFMTSQNLLIPQKQEWVNLRDVIKGVLWNATYVWMCNVLCFWRIYLVWVNQCKYHKCIAINVCLRCVLSSNIRFSWFFQWNLRFGQS